jgi:hypothetical protein
MTYLTEDELNERLRAAKDAAAQRRSERLRHRATFAATRGAGLQQRHATKLARLDRELSDPPIRTPPVAHAGRPWSDPAGHHYVAPLAGDRTGEPGNAVRPVRSPSGAP